MNDNHKDYSLRVPVKIKKLLGSILQLSSSGLKFGELCLLFEKKYKGKLELSFIDSNKMIIKINDEDNIQYGYSNYNDDNETEEDSEKFKDDMAKVDFSFEISRKSKNPSSYIEFTCPSNYFEINLRLPDISIEGSTIEMQNLFDMWNWKVDDTMPVFIGNIHDPSKFWIRLVPIDVFEEHICELYNMKKKSHSLEISDVCIGLNCVALVSNIYCRAKIVRTDIQDQKSVKVFLFDYGTLFKVQISELYYLDESISRIPAFAVRAMLTNISSLDHQMWSQNAVDRFVELTYEKPLIARIAHIHKKRKILEIHLVDSSSQIKSKIPTINYRLVNDGLAKFSCDSVNCEKDNKKQFKPLKELLYLYPSFEMIENGLAPSQVYLTEKLKECVPLDVIFPEFYEYQDQN